ncbi:hypothetical protein AB870_10425 [Pandoraea faecigallinarum]|uniref:Uncharacterized protein n=1 Tax=Pandoraea faecigallinarum TaxID=656179 RepID=A0A0H3WUZ2_9BURK|nr:MULTISPECIES: hypothetical protein [Burkholderiaceae]AKM30433.1 hypothetical protein AB870_10425 [Pandoraea faecigallinarum]PRG17614.1 hypothetical protein C6Q35_29225 [Burkholderia multivorans]
MNHTDFYIGLTFMDCTGWWRCTDVGARTILAIRLDHDDPHWYEGPPYIVKEEVFDEDDISRCHLTVEESIRAAVHAADNSEHPGFPHEVVERMMATRRAHPYPHEGVLRFDRKRPDGEVLHPYAGRKEGESWVVDLYLPFRGTYETMAERDFISLQRATPDDLRARASRLTST